MRVLRLIPKAVLFILAIPFVIVLVSAGFLLRRKEEPEEKQDEAAAIVAKEELDDASLEESDDDWIRRWLEDLGPTRRAKRIRRGYSQQMFRPVLPFVMRKRER